MFQVGDFNGDMFGSVLAAAAALLTAPCGASRKFQEPAVNTAKSEVRFNAAKRYFKNIFAPLLRGGQHIITEIDADIFKALVID